MTMSMSAQVISTARTCNCILIVLDAIKPITHKRLIEKELEGFGIRFHTHALSYTLWYPNFIVEEPHDSSSSICCPFTHGE